MTRREEILTTHVYEEFYLCSVCERLTVTGLCGCAGERELVGPLRLLHDWSRFTDEGGLK